MSSPDPSESTPGSCKTTARPPKSPGPPDPAESTPLDATVPATARLIDAINREREATLANIYSTARSTVNWNASAAGRAANCCNPEHAACRCDDGRF